MTEKQAISIWGRLLRGTRFIGTAVALCDKGVVMFTGINIDEDSTFAFWVPVRTVKSCNSQQLKSKLINSAKRMAPL